MNNTFIKLISFFVKGLMFLSLLLFSLPAYCQTLSDSTSRRIAILLDGLDKNNLTQEKKTEITNLTYEVQNRAFIFENDRKYNEALEIVNQTIPIWQVITDTLNEANMRKYKGLILGYLNKYADAKKEINRAKYLYSIKRFYFGVAVSNYDLSRVFENENKLDSSLTCIDSALRFWQAKKDTSRIVNNSNQILNLYIKMKKIDLAIAIQKQIQQIIHVSDIHWQPIIDFYFLSQKLYLAMGEKKETTYYENLLRKKIIEIPKNEMIKPKPLFN